MRLLTALILILTTLTCFAAGESAAYLRGKAAADSGNHEQAFDIFLAAARQGDPWSQFALGVLYLKGEGVQKDVAASTRWLQKAAAQGHAFAQFNLGNAYLNGRGLEPDTGKAAYWWQQAAEQGNRMAQSNLGTLLYFEYATPLARRLGTAWLLAAAGQGDRAARARLAETGEPLPGEAGTAWETEPEHGETRILTRNPDHYGIQLFSARRKSSVKRFLEAQGLAGRALVYRFPRDGAFWHGVLFGDYATEEAAKQTLEGMRASLKRQDPWVVRFGFIQDRIHSLHARLLQRQGSGIP